MTKKSCIDCIRGFRTLPFLHLHETLHPTRRKSLTFSLLALRSSRHCVSEPQGGCQLLQALTPFPIFINIRASTANVSAFIPRVFFPSSSITFSTSFVSYLITCFHPTGPSRGRPGSPHDLHLFYPCPAQLHPITPPQYLQNP